MAWRLVAIGVSLTLGAAVGCGDDDPKFPADTLPQRPQIRLNAQAGVVAFGLTVDTETDVIDIVFNNGGKDDLVIEKESDIRVVGRDAAAFVLQTVMPAIDDESRTRIVASREALTVRLAFTPNGRNVYLGTLIVESNAENFPSIEIELVGPGAGARVADAADIFVFETTSVLSMQAGVDVPVGLVRFFNLGGSGPDASTATLVIDAYTLSDSTNFAFLSGTAVAGAVCDVAGVCVPDTTAGQTQGCCGGLECDGTCDAVRVVSGQFVVFGVRLTDAAPSGGADTTVTIESNDPDEPQVTITIDGTP
ncbi:MAG: hypothetical protein V3T05_13170 [Myxococcota bacterium]